MGALVVGVTTHTNVDIGIIGTLKSNGRHDDIFAIIAMDVFQIEQQSSAGFFLQIEPSLVFSNNLRLVYLFLFLHGEYSYKRV